MGSPIRYNDFVRWFRRQGVELSLTGSHIGMCRVVKGVELHYTAVVHGNRVEDVYVKKARKALKLSLKDGVSDREFFR